VGEEEVTRQEALDLAAERGHAMEQVTKRDPAPWMVWNCTECSARVVKFGPNLYGSALERDCLSKVAA
jgi:hypothetical protein